MSLVDVSGNLIDSTLVVAIFSAVFYFFGILLDPNVEFNRYIQGFLFVVSHIFLPAIAFFILHYKIPDYGSLYDDFLSLGLDRYLILFSIFQFFVTSFLIILIECLQDSSNNWIKRQIRMIPIYPFWSNILNMLISWIMVVLGLYYSVNKDFNPVNSFNPEVKFPGEFIPSTGKIFLIWLPMLLSITIICLIAILFVLIRKTQGDDTRVKIA